MTFTDHKRIIFLAVMILFCGPVYADDPGITKVRLIQETDTSYIFELDIARQFLWTIKAPILPDRFRISDPDYEDQSGWITLKVKITTSGEPFSSKDEILLPWQRNGVDITVQWKDGQTYKGLFNKTLNGIHIPMSKLMPVQKTTREVIQESFVMGIRHLPFMFVHVLLIIVLVWAFPSLAALRYLFMLTLGQMTALILAELGMPGFSLLLSDLMLLLITFLVSYSVIYKIEFKFLKLLLFLAGAFHGLSFVQDLNVVDLPPLQRIQALFAFNLSLDLGHYVLALVLLLIIPSLYKLFNGFKWLTILAGSMSVFLVLLIFSENIMANKLQILSPQKSPVSVTYKSSGQIANLSTKQVQRGKGLMVTPLMLYLSVEPYEVRQEILVQASTVMQYLNCKDNGSGTIPVESQEQIKTEIQEAITSANTIYVDNQLLAPADKITSFVTLGRGGVATRENPMEENLEEAIMGITLIYDIEAFPDSILIQWQLFPDSVRFIEASAVDPHGAFTAMLSPGENMLRWKSRLAGYRVPAIEAIEIERRSQPLIAILLWMGILLFLVYKLVRKKQLYVAKWMMVVLVLGFLTYPFIRFPMNLPLLPKGKPSSERTSVILSDLLTNVYRAFDRRKENDVYDRLAISVSGNQLTEIYLQNRQSMELENRGSARANVDEVNIQELSDLKHHKDHGYVADTRWTVRGSVNHFGHTHYRQNQYRALVSFGIDNETWKIYNIEILDTRRLY